MPPAIPDWIWIQNVIFPILGMGMGALFMVGAYRIAMRWIDRRHERLMVEGGKGGGSAELQQLRERMEQLEDVAARLQDVEERLDFTERVLSQQRERGQLPAGGDRG